MNRSYFAEQDHPLTVRRATSSELREIDQLVTALIAADEKRREPIAYDELRWAVTEGKGLGSGVLRRLKSRWNHLLLPKPVEGEKTVRIEDVLGDLDDLLPNVAEERERADVEDRMARLAAFEELGRRLGR